MKSFTNATRYIVYIVLMAVSGCVADPILENVDNGSDDISQTRVQSGEKYYYAFDEKVPLHEVADRMVVTFDKEHRSSVEERIIQSAQDSKEKLQIHEGYSGGHSIITLSSDANKKALRDELSKQTGVKSVRQVYAIDDGYEMAYTNEIIMQFREGASQEHIAEMHKRFNVEVIKTSKLYVHLSVPVEFDPLDVANAYQESGLTKYSHPSFITSMESYQSLPTDPYFNNQFYLRNTGQGVNGRTSTAGADINIVNAWAITKGNPNIVVAVIDGDGFTPNHPDMPNMLSGRNFGSGGANNYSPSGNSNHGNACAGIIGAAHNNGEGIAGIAPNCKILPIKLSTIYVPDYVDAIQFAADNADVISCSWGWTVADSNIYPAIVEAIRYATTSGRRGNKGSVVVFAASNSANHVRGEDGVVAFPANVKVSGVLTVGAVDRNGQQANYSPTSNPSSSHNQIIDVLAPSHRAYSTQISSETLDVWSIDIPGSAGYNYVHETDGGSLPIIGSYLPNSGINYEAYTGHFGGTSAAAPQVAGIAALILSAYPNLTQQQVADIIMRTASRARSGLSRNNEIGYGLVNAYEALLYPLAISGPDIPYVGSTVRYSVPTTLPPGMTFSGWEVPPAPYAVVGGGTSNPTLNIVFAGPGGFVIDANFTSNGTTHTIWKRVMVEHVFATPILRVNRAQGAGGGSVTVYNWTTGATYKWEEMNGIFPPTTTSVPYLVINSPNGVTIPPTVMNIRCKAINPQRVETPWSAITTVVFY